MIDDLIHRAFENLYHGIDIRYELGVNYEDNELDIILNNRRYRYQVDTHKEPRQHHIDKLINTNQTNPNKPPLLVAETIFPKLRAQLKTYNINYIDLHGNVFLKNHDLYIYIECPNKVVQKKNVGNRAFTKTGLKVLFHFLVNKELINQNQRTIKDETGVALGNIPKVLEGLKETGHLMAIDKKRFTLTNKRELIDRWIEGYQTQLRPTLKKRTYVSDIPWQDIDLNKKIAIWGGEGAADLLTHYLRPEKHILYTNEDQANLIRNYKLKPKREGNIEVVEMFWNTTYNDITAPPLLVYADLLIEGGKRNLETAKMIYNEHIEPNL